MFWLVSAAALFEPIPPAPMTATLTVSLGFSLRILPSAVPGTAAKAAALPMKVRRERGKSLMKGPNV